MPGEFVINEMRPDDWDQVRDIYVEGLATGQSTFETQAPDWPAWNEAHHQHGRLVARHLSQVVGWAALAPVSRRPCYAGVAEASLYVATRWQGQGIGKRLLEALIASSEQHGIWTLTGSTFPENTASIRLQERCGFRLVGRRERIGQLHGVWRDTVLTERRSKKVGIETASNPSLAET
jgi:L-amino acid N-acyltransferase YncA